MKIRTLAGVVLILAGFSVAVQAAEVDPSWKWQREIVADHTTEFNRFEIPAEIYKKTQMGLGDLRIVDEKGTGVPYLLESNRFTEATVEEAFQFYPVGEFKKRADTVFDFQGQAPEGTDLLVNQLRADSAYEGDFFKYVELYGSHDGKHWEGLGTQSLYRIEGKDQNTFDLGPAQKFTAYRIVILDNGEGVRLSGLSGILINVSETQVTHQRVFTAAQFQRQEVNTATEIRLQQVGNLPANAVSMEATGLFHRPCRILSGDNPADGAVFGSGYLFQSTLKGTEPLRNQLAMEIYQPVDTLTLVIENGDNPPLDIQSVTLDYVADSVVFQTAPGKIYALQYGSPTAPKPQYDLEQFRAEIAQQKIAAAALGPETEIPAVEQPKSPGVNQKALFSGLIFLVALVLAWMAIRGMRKP